MNKEIALHSTHYANKYTVSMENSIEINRGGQSKFYTITPNRMKRINKLVKHGWEITKNIQTNDLSLIVYSKSPIM